MTDKRAIAERSHSDAIIVSLRHKRALADFRHAHACEYQFRGTHAEDCEPACYFGDGDEEHFCDNCKAAIPLQRAVDTAIYNAKLARQRLMRVLDKAA